MMVQEGSAEPNPSAVEAASSIALTVSPSPALPSLLCSRALISGAVRFDGFPLQYEALLWDTRK